MSGIGDRPVSTYRQWLLVAIALLFSVGWFSCHAQAGSGNAVVAQSSDQSAPVSSGITINPGDVVAVSVFDTPELSGNVRVSENGSVDLPLLGIIHIAGMSEAAASHLIDEDYIRRGVLLHASTSVLIRDFASKGVSITGEVVKPGIYPLAGPRSLVDIIALAGGLTPAADTRLTIRRVDATTEPLTVSLPQDNGPTSFSNDVQVYPGDRIIAQRSGIIYVLGEVNHPGGYAMAHNGKLTVLQAVAAATGTTRFAGAKNTVLIRRAGDTYTTTRLALNDIYRGKQPDVVMMPDDVLFIPDSNVRNFIVNAPQILSQIAGAAIYSLHP